MNSLLRLQRAIPLAGLFANRLRFPGLLTGLHVEITASGDFLYGKGVRIGQGTRIELFQGGTIDIGANVSISRSVHLAAGPAQQIRIGSRTTVQDNCRLYGDVIIGRDCILAPNVFVSSATHAFETIPHRLIHEQERLAPMQDRPVQIRDDCWLGINAVVTPGTTIGRGCVVGANAVVTKDLPPYSVAAGNPATVVRQRLAFTPKARIDATIEEDWPYFYSGFEASTDGDAGLIADREFVLAMQRPQVSSVRLCLSGGGRLAYGSQSKTLPEHPDVIEFQFERAGGSGPFLNFRTNCRCSSSNASSRSLPP